MSTTSPWDDDPTAIPPGLHGAFFVAFHLLADVLAVWKAAELAVDAITRIFFG